MHPNQVFHTKSDADNLAFARDRGFGVLAVCGDGAADGVPALAHVPFLLSGDGKSADLHLVRSNPIARALLEPVPARVAVSGPDSYISPDWYGIDDQVPTWNYVAVHLTGTLERRPDSELRGILDRLSDQFEARLAPKAPWRADKMDSDARDRLMRMIMPFRLNISGVDGTWKLGQNKPGPVREQAAEHVEAFGIGSEARILAALMRGA
jgi:transcriptional regulator